MILLVHAGIADASMWDGFDLPGAERHELRGFGDTPMPGDGEFSHADDLEARIGDGPATLVGASFGGAAVRAPLARAPMIRACEKVRSAAATRRATAPRGRTKRRIAPLTAAGGSVLSPSRC